MPSSPCESLVEERNLREAVAPIVTDRLASAGPEAQRGLGLRADSARPDGCDEPAGTVVRLIPTVEVVERGCCEPRRIQAEGDLYRYSLLLSIIEIMSGAAYDFEGQLEDALTRRGFARDVDAILAAFDEVGASTSEALTAGERDFLLEHTDLTEEELTPQKYAEDRRLVARARLRAERRVRADALSTADVAKLLERPTPSIRRSKIAGDLYALPSGSGRAMKFPLWQFVDGAVVPGLRDIIPAFPRHMHPQSIEQFMTQPLEELSNRSPVEWLASGGDTDVVAALVDELSYE